MGRKNRYETHVKPHLEEIPKWYESLTEGQIAEKLGIAVSTFEKYKTKYPELADVLQKSKKTLVDELKNSLKRKARGYYYTETKIRKVPTKNGEVVEYKEVYKRYAHPDTGAIHLLLKNNDESWRNDDKATMDLKEKQVSLTEKKIEQNEW